MESKRMYKVLHCHNLQITNSPHSSTIIAWNNGFYLLELGGTEERSMNKAKRILESALPGLSKEMATGKIITSDDYLNIAKSAYFTYAFLSGASYNETITLDVIIGLEREILYSQLSSINPSDNESGNAVRKPRKAAKKIANKLPAAQAIPESIQNARKSILELVSSGDIAFVKGKVAWTDSSIYFGPFDVAVRTDVESGSLELISSIGKVSSTAPLEELFSELPIGPVEFSYELQPNPVVKHRGQMSLAEASNPEYLLRFIHHHVLCTLVMAVVLVSANLLISPSNDHLQMFELNEGQKYFEDVLSYRELLQPLRSKKIGDTE